MDTADSKEKKDRGPVRIPEWLEQEIAALQADYMRRTGKRPPSKGDLIGERWRAAQGKPTPNVVEVKRPPEPKEVSLFRDFLENADPEAVKIVLDMLKFSGFRRPPAEGLGRDLAKG